MPKTFYLTRDEIPNDQAGCYEAGNGRWELTKLDDDHPVVVTKKELETTQGNLKTQIQTLRQEKAIIENKSLPEGMVAAALEVKELGEAAQSAGLTKKEIPTLKTRADQAEAKLKERDELDLINRIADETGRNRIAFAEHVKANNLKFETETESLDGENVSSLFVITTDNEGKEGKISLSEYLKSKASHLAPARKEKFEVEETIDVIDQESGEKNKNTGNEFDVIRKEIERRAESAGKLKGAISFADKFYNSHASLTNPAKAETAIVKRLLNQKLFND